MTDAEIIAELFGCPCNYTPIDEEMCANYDCEHLCGTPEQNDAKCWQRYFDLKRKEAVEAEILLTPYPTICLDDCKDYDFKDGQKVRVIII